MIPLRSLGPVALAAVLALGLPATARAAGHNAAPRGSSRHATVVPYFDRDAYRGDDRGRVLIQVPFGFSDYWLYGPPLGAGFGWWGWPYADWGPYGPPYGRAYSYVRVIPADAGGLELHVHPWKAEVRIDGAPVGQARDHNGQYDALWLKAGRHIVTLNAPGFQTLKVAVSVGPGGYLSLRERMREGEGVDARSIRESEHHGTPAQR